MEPRRSTKCRPPTRGKSRPPGGARWYSSGPMAAPQAPSPMRALAARALPYAPALAASGALGALCVRAVLEQAGRPAVPLDDAFIHMQYARRLAEGGFFSFVAGDGYSTGATSLLWPVLLAPFHALG